MDNISEPNPQAVGISDAERGRIFVTMNATFRDEEKCRVAMETIVNDAHAAYGVTSHFWFRSEDGKSLFVVEQYADGRALSKAVRRFTTARIAFFRSIKVADVSVYGDASLGIKIAFAPLSPNYMNYYEGYSKPAPGARESGIKDFERKRVFVATNATFKDEAQGTDAMRALVQIAHAAPGVHSHFWTRGNDSKALFVLEQYADEEALVGALDANQASRAALLETMEVRDVTVYGAQSDEVKKTLAPLRPTYMDYYGGYSK